MSTSKSELYHGLNRAFAEVRQMLDGKKKEKSLDVFLEELRNEREKRSFPRKRHRNQANDR